MWQSFYTTMVKHSLLRNSPINIIGVDEGLTIEAAKLKLKYYNVLSLADCYLIALAKQRKAVIITMDQNIKSVDETPVTLLQIQKPRKG